MRRIAATAALVLVVGFSMGARADIWKWVDAQGHLHYSDLPVPGAVLIKSSSDHSPSDDSDSDDQQALAARNRQITAELNQEAAARTVQKDEAGIRAKLCKQAQSHYDKVIHARRIYTTGPNGERHYLTDAEAQKARVQAELDVHKYCDSDSE